MAIPKVDRDSGIFEPPVCDRINKKTQLLTNNMMQLKVPPLEPKYDVLQANAHIDVEQMISKYHRDAYWSTDPTTGQQTYHPEVNHTATCKPVITSNNSFTIGSDYSQVNIINMTIELQDSKLDGKEKKDGYISLDGKMFYIGKVKKAPICDVWFSAQEGSCLFHIPEGRNEIWILPLVDTTSIDVYTFYI